MRPKDLVILESNDGDSDIDVDVDELFGNEENIEDENETMPSEMFTKIDWDIFYSVCEQKWTLGDRNISVDTLLQKLDYLTLAVFTWCFCYENVK